MYDNPVQISNFPSTLTHLNLREPRIQFSFLDLPPSLTSLTMEEYSKELHDLPASLNVLKLGFTFRGRLDNLPASLEHLYIRSGYFNQPLNNLPLTLKTLVIGQPYSAGINQFSHTLDKLPPGLKKLAIKLNFNHPLDSLPATLEYLSIRGSTFNRPLNQLPNSLMRLIILAEKFNQDLNSLPQSLQYLQLGKIFKQNVYYREDTTIYQPLSKLPSSLTTLKIFWYHYSQPLTFLPSSLKVLDIRNSSIQHTELPQSLTHFRACAALKQVNFPQSLTHLTFNDLDTALPSGLTHLSIKRSDGDVTTDLPESLTYLKLSCDYTQEHLPPNLTHLTFSWNFDRPLPPLPKSITHLTFGDIFNHPLSLPPALEHLRLGEHFNSSLPDSFPPTLKYMRVGRVMDDHHKLAKLPPSLIDFHIDKITSIPAIEFLPPTVKTVTMSEEIFDTNSVLATIPLPPIQFRTLHCSFVLLSDRTLKSIIRLCTTTEGNREKNIPVCFKERD